MVQDVNSHRGMTPVDHHLHSPDSRGPNGSTGNEQRWGWAQLGSNDVVNDLAAANAKINKEQWCDCWHPSFTAIYFRFAIREGIIFLFEQGQARSDYWDHVPLMTPPEQRYPVQWNSAYGLHPQGAATPWNPEWRVYR